MIKAGVEFSMCIKEGKRHICSSCSKELRTRCETLYLLDKRVTDDPRNKEIECQIS